MKNDKPPKVYVIICGGRKEIFTDESEARARYALCPYAFFHEYNSYEEANAAFEVKEPKRRVSNDSKVLIDISAIKGKKNYVQFDSIAPDDKEITCSVEVPFDLPYNVLEYISLYLALKLTNGDATISCTDNLIRIAQYYIPLWRKNEWKFHPLNYRLFQEIDKELSLRHVEFKSANIKIKQQSCFLINGKKGDRTFLDKEIENVKRFLYDKKLATT